MELQAVSFHALFFPLCLCRAARGSADIPILPHSHTILLKHAVNLKRKRTLFAGKACFHQPIVLSASRCHINVRIPTPTPTPNSGACRKSGGLLMALTDVIRLQVTLWTERDQRSTTSEDRIVLVEGLKTSVGTLHYYFLLKYGSSINYSAQRNTERSPENPLEVAHSHRFRKSFPYFEHFLFCTVGLEREGKKHTNAVFIPTRAPSFFRQELIGNKEPKLIQRLSSWHSTEGQVKCGNLTDTDTGQSERDLWLNCHSLPSAALQSQMSRPSARDTEWKGSSKPSSDRRVIVWIEGMGGGRGAVCPHCEVARNLQTLGFSSNISPSLLRFFLKSLLLLWAVEESAKSTFHLSKERESKSHWTYASLT